MPSINKNLLRVSQFARDNGVVFADHCFVKKQVTKEIILQGKVLDGLYVFSHLQRPMPPSVHKQPFDNTVSSNTIVNNYDIWHKRLCHASKNIVHHALHLQYISYTKTVELCDSCAKAKTHQLPFPPSLTLPQMGFLSSKSDTSLFTRFTSSETLFILIYVDDILLLVVPLSWCMILFTNLALTLL